MAAMPRRPRRRDRVRSPRPDQSGPGPGSRTPNPYIVLAVCAGLVVLTAIVFGATAHHGFVNYDDEPYVLENPHVARGLTVEGLRWAFTQSHASNWHPLTWLSHMADVELFGLTHPGGHHLTSVLLHAATAVVLFLVLLQMTAAGWPSAFAAALFAVHPLHVESVAWIAERKDVLSGLFFVLTHCCIRAVRPAAPVVSAVSARGGTVHPGPSEQTDARDAAVRAAATGLLAARTPLDRNDPKRCAGRAAQPARGGDTAATREAAAVRAGDRSGSHYVHGAGLGARIAVTPARMVAGCERAELVRGLSLEVRVSGPTGRVLPASRRRLALMADCCRLPRPRSRVRRCLDLAATASIPAGWVALVSRDARSRHRVRAGWLAGHGGSLHLSHTDRALHCGSVGSHAPCGYIPLPSLDVRCRRVRSDSDPVSSCLAAGLVLARQRDALESRAGLHGEES